MAGAISVDQFSPVFQRFDFTKVRNSTCPLAWDKWIFRRTTKIANIVVRRTTWIAAGSVTRHILVSDFNGIPLIQSRQA